MTSNSVRAMFLGRAKVNGDQVLLLFRVGNETVQVPGQFVETDERIAKNWARNVISLKYGQAVADEFVQAYRVTENDNRDTVLEACRTWLLQRRMDNSLEHLTGSGYPRRDVGRFVQQLPPSYLLSEEPTPDELIARYESWRREQ